MHLDSLQRDCGRLDTRSIVSREIVGQCMLDLAGTTAGDKFTSLLKKYWWDSSKFSLVVTSVIITYLVAFSATNMCIYIPQGSSWACDASMGEVCTSVLFISLLVVSSGMWHPCMVILNILLRGCVCSTLKYMKAAMPAFSRECACSTSKYNKAAMLVVMQCLSRQQKVGVHCVCIPVK